MRHHRTSVRTGVGTLALLAASLAAAGVHAQSGLPSLPKANTPPAQQAPAQTAPAQQAPAAQAAPPPAAQPAAPPAARTTAPGLPGLPGQQQAPAQAASPPAAAPAAAPPAAPPAVAQPAFQPAPVAGFDPVFERPTAEVYPPEQRQSEWHMLAEPVKPQGSPTPLGLWNQTTIQSRYGNMEPRNESFTRIRIREIEAVTKLKAIDTGETVVGGISNAAAAPFRAVGALLTSPLETLGNIPKGISDTIARTGEGFSSDKSKFEDGMFKEIAGVSRKKREIAAEMGVDVYSSNPILQSELNRIGAASAGGNITVDVGSIAISGPAGAVIGNLSRVDALQEIVNTQPAAELRRRARYTLEQMAIPKSFVDQFLDHPYYSPRRKTIVVGLLSPMKDVAGRERILEAALTADSEEAALYYQQLTELISGFHFTNTPVKEIMLVEGFPVALTGKASAFIAVPTDRMYWTREAAQFLDRMLTDLIKNHRMTSATLWTLGDLTPLTAQALAQRGIHAFQRAVVNYN